jgi:hypothetical protein
VLSPEEVRARAAKLEKDVRRRNVREYVASAVVVVGCVSIAALGTATVLLRIACAAGVVSAVSISARVRRAGWRACPTHDGASDETWREALRDALVRQRDLLGTAWRWYVAPFAGTVALFLVSAAFELMVPPDRVAIAAGLCAAMSLAVAWTNRGAAAKMQREIDVLEAR